MARQRISHEPAFVLHRHDWSESSLIVELLTRHHGRIAVAARGARRPGSALRPVLLPLQPLRVTCSLGSEHAEIHNLRAAEWAGGHIMPQGDALLSGYYLNELLLGLLARDDAHEKLFDAYEVVVGILADGHPDALEPVLRAFELLLLREAGVLPDLSLQTTTAQPLQPQACYALAPESGLRLALPQERGNLPGAHWLRIQLALDSGAGCVAVMQACVESVQALKPQLRALLQHHCASHAFRTRQLMVDMQSLA